MTRVKNLKEFIEKAKIIHGNKYDYSRAEYIKSSEKIIIICDKHGEFKQTPNKHLAGQGCNQCCVKGKPKLTNDDFISRTKMIFGCKYDYSKTNYIGLNHNVLIICPIHGEFSKKARLHINQKQGCPKCGQIQAGNKRKGFNNVAHRMDVKLKKMNTCMRKYGSNSWTSSSEGRQTLSNIISNPEVLSKMKQTCQIKYGSDFYSSSKEGIKRQIELMNTPEMKQAIRKGYVDKYGDHYMSTLEGHKKAKNYINDNRRKKMRQSMLARYGVPYSAMCTDILNKINQTKCKNGTFNTSKPEETLYLLLCDTFGKNNVIVQYKDDLRYPFHCDFYVQSEDLFIELNAHWSHGGRWFDPNDEDCIEVLNQWRTRARQKGSKYYYRAINVWTYRDLLKREYAIDNKLNYLVFWKSDLSDVREYLSNIGRL